MPKSPKQEAWEVNVLPALMQELSSRLNITQQQALADALARDVLRKQGGPWKHRTAISAEDSAEIRRLRMEGMETRDIGRKVGRTAAAVQQHLQVVHPDLIDPRGSVNGALGAVTQGKVVRHERINAALAKS
jgi:2-keto-4-pentenoate hydratase